MFKHRAVRPSIRGLFDLHGNLFEWTHDWYGEYASLATTDPLVNKGGSNRVFRGGSWYNDAAFCRSAYPPRERADAPLRTATAFAWP